jgi:hypothetical protein
MSSDSDRNTYRPRVDSNDRLLEDEPSYVRRMAAVLPHFPADVLGQWFFDHWMQIGDNSWMDYPSLRFTDVRWTTSEVPIEDFGHEELLASLVRYFESESDLPKRHSRLLAYMTSEGTWPRPIIVLDTKTNLRDRPPWLSNGPYHLLEGHNRVAGIRYLRDRVHPRPSHSVWVVSREPAP